MKLKRQTIFRKKTKILKISSRQSHLHPTTFQINYYALGAPGRGRLQQVKALQG